MFYFIFGGYLWWLLWPEGDNMYPIEDDFDDIQCEDFYGDDYEAVETDS